MRALLRQAIVTTGLFGNRVYEIQVPSGTTQKPFCVIKLASDTSTDEWIQYRRTFEIYPYLERNSFVELDTTVKSLIQSLDKKLIKNDETKEAFTCLYRSSGMDFIEDEWDAITRVLYFDVLALRYVEEDIHSNDEWISYIALLLQSKLSGWAVYTGALPTDYVFPSILVRLSSSSMEKLGANIYRERKLVKIHLITNNSADKENGINTILGLFPKSEKVAYNTTFYQIESVLVSLESDTYSSGQVTVELSKTLIYSKELTKINAVNIKGGV